MRKSILTLLMLGSLTVCSLVDLEAQNRNFTVGISVGVGNSGFNVKPQEDGNFKRILYPTGGLQIQKRISDKWALNLYPNLGMSGNKRILDNPIGSINEVRSTSAFVNLALHPKYFLTESFYFSLGPEFSYLLWNYGSSYNNGERISNIKETDFFNRANFLISSSFGLSMKVAESRKGAPIAIDALWHLELRAKKGVTNILDKSTLGENTSATVLSFELVTGISFTSKK